MNRLRILLAIVLGMATLGALGCNEELRRDCEECHSGTPGDDAGPRDQGDIFDDTTDDASAVE